MKRIHFIVAIGFLYGKIELKPGIVFFTTLYNTTNYTYDNQENPVTSVDMPENSNTYNYYSDLTNNFNLGQTFFPQSVNFLKTYILNAGGTTVTTTPYYTFDNQKRLIKYNASITNSDFPFANMYVYLNQIVHFFGILKFIIKEASFLYCIYNQTP